METRGNLWALIDVYGNSTAVELLDPRQQLNNAPAAVPRRIAPPQEPTAVVLAAPAPIVRPQRPPQAANPAAAGTVVPSSGLQHLPVPWHRARGRMVRLSNDRYVLVPYTCFACTCC